MIRPPRTSLLRFFTAVLAFCALFFLASAAGAASLTEASVQELIAALDRAVRSRDSKGVARLLSSDFRVNAQISAYGQRQNLNLNKTQYLNMLEDSWEGMAGYSYERSHLSIRLLPDGSSAEVAATVRETATTGGVSVRMSSAETATVRMIGGRLLVTRVIARSRPD